jgi:NSS family neurotransmitter:Na+ symporter
VSLLAGLAIFPAVFSFGIEPTEGPGLLFVALPSVFEQMPFGVVFLTIFLILFLFATLTSSFSMLEIITSALGKGEVEKRKKFSWIGGIIVFVVGVFPALSYGALSHVTLFNKNIFDLFDFLVSNMMLPLGSLAISIFVGYRMKRETLLEEFQSGSSIGKRVFILWLFLLKYLLPLIIIVVFLGGLPIWK